MSVAVAPLDSAEVARLGKEIYARVVIPELRPEDHGKFVVVDVVSGDYEIDADDYTASKRLRERRTAGEFWMMMAGFPTAYRFAGVRCSAAVCSPVGGRSSRF